VAEELDVPSASVKEVRVESPPPVQSTIVDEEAGQTAQSDEQMQVEWEELRCRRNVSYDRTNTGTRGRLLWSQKLHSSGFLYGTAMDEHL